jgi:hypothetical protein
MGDTGFGPSPLALSKTPISETGGAKSGAPKDEIARTDPDLALLVERWPGLHPAVKEHILSILRSVSDKE